MKNLHLLHAILSEDFTTIRLLRDDKTLRNERDEWGYTPVEIAKYFNKIKCLRVLREWNPQKFKVFPKSSKQLLEYNDVEMEELFNFQPIEFNYFFDLSLFLKTLNNCPYLYKYSWIAKKYSPMKKGDFAIRWIDETLGYGLFNEKYLKAEDFIGEYVGEIRIINKTDPKLNGYCVHYPTKWFSKEYTVIDAKNYGNELRFVNHSDDPNLVARWGYDRNLLHLYFFAKKDIPPDSQLTIDYGEDYWQFREKVGKN